MKNLPRKKAVMMLLKIEKDSAYINIEMNALRKSGEYDEKDIRFIGELVNGVIKICSECFENRDISDDIYG